MSLNPLKKKSNMYGFITATYNTVKGECKDHDCAYCYMKRFKNQKEVRFDKKELRTDLGKGNYIFVGSSNDMWAEGIKASWIKKTLKHCQKHPDNQYLFQTKNPKRFEEFVSLIPKGSILCTTIETNDELLIREVSKAPTIEERRVCIRLMREKYHFKIMVTIEPIMDFNYKVLTWILDSIGPDYINIGADSGNNDLKEPSKEKVDMLINYLQTRFNIVQKSNLNRLVK